MKLDKENLTFTEDKLLRTHGAESSYRRPPIEVWWDLVNSEKTLEVEGKLKEIYECNLPELGEIIFTSNCEFACKHCIYHPDYNKFIPDLDLDLWKKIIKNIYLDLGIKIFVHCGRSLDNTGINVLKWIRRSFSDVRLGLIDNGISIIPYFDELTDIQLDWIDISIDGMEREHELQRNRKGSFKKSINTIDYLKEKEVAPKINILSCLTNINKDSIIDLIGFLNQKGFKNFFISPVSILKDYGPSEELKVANRDFVKFIENIYNSLCEFEDTWIELDIYGIEYMKYIKEFYPELWYEFRVEEDHLIWNTSLKDNEFYINYYPLSLNGIREFTVNSDGNVILPLVVRKGKLSDKDIVGNLLVQEPSLIMERLRNLRLEFFINALMKEKRYIGGE